MKLKSYFSGTVEAAMELARKELGDDALLVNARPATPETRKLGAFEVVFGVLPPPPPAAADPPAEPAGAAGSGAVSPATAGSPAAGPCTQEIDGLRREIARMAQTLRGLHLARPQGSPEEWDLRARLQEAELDPDLVERVLQGAPLGEHFSVDAALGRPGARAVVALVGPPGAGKTTTLIKLAARYGIASRRPAHIISTDVFRIAAADQLRTLAAIVGIGCTVVEAAGALTQALEEQHGKDLVFIDTPGFGAHDMADGAELAQWFAARPEIDTHLVLSAAMRPADLSATIDRYQMYHPAKLLFTHLDEATCFGTLVTESARRSLPVSFLAAGQQIPDDLEPATKERLSELVQGGTQVRSVAVAAGVPA
jgi:flagellar biosynthesis protein FlhF